MRDDKLHELAERVRVLVDNRPVRWRLGRIEEFVATLDIFNADVDDQMVFMRRLRDVRPELDAAVGGAVIVMFHTRKESRRLYADVLAAHEAASSA